MKRLVLTLFVVIVWICSSLPAEAGPYRRAIAWKRDHRPVVRWFANHQPVRRVIRWKRDHTPVRDCLFGFNVDQAELPV